MTPSEADQPAGEDIAEVPICPGGRRRIVCDTAALHPAEPSDRDDGSSGAAPFDGRATFLEAARSLYLEADELLPIGKTLHCLRFVDLEPDEIRLTKTGRQFALAGPDNRKKLFASAVLAQAGKIAAVYWILLAQRPGRLCASTYRDLLQEQMPPDHATETLRGAVLWGDYAGLFRFDEETREFVLEGVELTAERSPERQPPAVTEAHSARIS